MNTNTKNQEPRILTPRKTSSVVTDCLNFISYSGTILGSDCSAVWQLVTSELCQISLPSVSSRAWGPVWSCWETFDEPMCPGPDEKKLF